MARRRQTTPATVTTTAAAATAAIPHGHVGHWLVQHPVGQPVALHASRFRRAVTRHAVESTVVPPR